MAAIRVRNQFRVTTVMTTSVGGKNVDLIPVYSGDPDFGTGLTLASNAERSIQIYVPKNSSSIDTFVIGDYYYMDLTAV